MRWAIFGTGFISNTVIESITRSEHSTIEVIAGRSPERLADFALRHDVTKTSTDLYEVLQRPEVDAVYIGLPNHKHHELAVAAAAAGKPVLSEKSLTTTLESAHELIDGVREHGTFFVEGLMYLNHPVIRRFVELLADGRLGSIRSIRASYAANIADLVNPAGMGTIYNLGCYPVSLTHLVVQTLLGESAFRDRRMVAVGNVSPADGTVVDAALSVRFGGGVLASISSTDSYGMATEFAVSGDNGVLQFDTNPWLPTAGTNSITWEPFEGERETFADDDPLDGFDCQIAMVERSVAAGLTEAERPAPRLNDSLEIMEMLTEWESLIRETTTT